ncbi:hypothetical protein ACFE04_009565 [Oxalis oulophora]
MTDVNYQVGRDAQEEDKKKNEEEKKKDDHGYTWDFDGLCNLCTKTFNSHSCVINHQASGHTSDETKYKCPKCKRWFPEKSKAVLDSLFVFISSDSRFDVWCTQAISSDYQD